MRERIFDIGIGPCHLVTTEAVNGKRSTYVVVTLSPKKNGAMISDHRAGIIKGGTN